MLILMYLNIGDQNKLKCDVWEGGGGKLNIMHKMSKIFSALLWGEVGIKKYE